MEAAPAGPSRRVCLMMARLEQGESGNAQAARDWLDRAIGAPPDPCYICGVCGGESAEWQPLCPVCGAFDTLTWRMPLHGNRAIASQAASAAQPLMLPAS